MTSNADANFTGSDLRLIAFHVPRFHPIPGSDAGQGKGFSDWACVTRARPLFKDHRQPRLPTELGFYDLRLPEAMIEQAKLASQYGITGFCYHYYRFVGGKRLFERPLEQMLASGQPNFPFCLCWTTESGTLRGSNNEPEVSVKQEHSTEDDLAFILDVARFFKDPRYIRIGGKPLLIIDRPELFADPRVTTDLWRRVMHEKGVGSIFLACLEKDRELDHYALGFDAAIEFPPTSIDLPVEDETLQSAHIAIHDYDRAVYQALTRPARDGLRFRCVLPSLDTTPQGEEYRVFVNASSEKYQYWLSNVIRQAERNRPEHRVVFINAWNDWTAGCYLEPDEQHGRGYLEATLRAAQRKSYEPGLFLERFRYAAWKEHRHFSEDVIALHRARLEESGGLTPFQVFLVFDGQDGNVLAKSIHSIAEQCYPDVTITVVSPTRSPWGGDNPRLRWLQCDTDVVATVNQAVQSIEKEAWIWMVGAGDTLAPRALWRVAEALSRNPSWSVLYADEEALSSAGNAVAPCFKPDFNLDLLRSSAYIGRSVAVSAKLLGRIGGFEGTSILDVFLDVALKCFEQHGEKSIGHVADILLATSHQPPLSSAALQDRLQLVTRHFERLGQAVSLAEGILPGTIRAIHRHATKPLVSIIIPTKDQLPLLQRCIESLVNQTRYEHYEILVVDNASETKEAQEYLRGLAQIDPDRIRVLPYKQPFNFSAMNNLAARAARGEYLLLLNNDTAVLHADWLENMMSHAQRPEVGIVGARLVFADGTVQHAGVIIGLSGAADHVFAHAAPDEPGQLGRLLLEQNFSAVTAACLLVRKTIYDSLGGLDEEDFKVLFNDVDFCLRVRDQGFLIVWTPYATLLHDGSASLKRPTIEARTLAQRRERAAREENALISRWKHLMGADPAYNVNLSLRLHHCQIENDPLINWNPLPWNPLPRVVAFQGDSGGCSHYRVRSPLLALSAQNRVVGMATTSHYSPGDVERINPDTLVLQRQIREDLRLAIERYKNYSSALRIFELDDLITDFPERCAHRAGFGPETASALRSSIALCDRLVVSTQPLADAYGQWAAEVVIAKNYLARESWDSLAPARRQGHKPRVGWAGGGGHDGDLEMISEVVRSLANEVDWVFMGMCPNALRPFVKEFHRWSPVAEYPSRLAALNLDLAIAPLVDHPFNNAKSNIKLLEYGVLGYPIVCSDVLPYQDRTFPVTRVANRAQVWIKAIREHIHDLDEAARLGDRLRDHVRANWWLEDHVDEWARAWLR